ncbi:MAG: GNAT family N-acetyltransferase [Chloroflexi bacterium]|nr:GNAT family N-acetyltransferase [Chloroflexota bacterium]
METAVTQESFDSLADYWSDPSHQFRWNAVFILPAWLKVWWQELNADAELYLRAVRQGKKIIGIAALLVRDGKASIIGSADVCDYLDFIVTPGMENDFFTTLLDDLRQKGISQLDLGPLRPDSTVLTNLVGIAEQRKYEVICHPEDVSLELDLPATWDEYLAVLTTKQRHEVRRKLRRLQKAGKIDYRCVNGNRPVEDSMDTFLKLFALARQEKADFMNARRESFFRSLVRVMGEIGLLRFGILELDGVRAAMIMGFDYNGAIYLYNSAYDPQYDSLSVGLLCKVFGIKQSIESGKKKWDFLKGDETYKTHLGGREVPLYRCQITIK